MLNEQKFKAISKNKVKEGLEDWAIMRMAANKHMMSLFYLSLSTRVKTDPETKSKTQAHM